MKSTVETLNNSLQLDGSAEQTRITPLAVPKLASFLDSIALSHGVEVAYVRRLIKLLDHPESAHVVAWSWPIRIYTLGRFSVSLDGKPIKTSKARTKPLDLLRALIACGGRSVDVELLMSAVWTEEQTNARANFDVAVMRLRKLLGHQDALLLTDGKLTLNDELCWVDCWAFERAVTQLDSVNDVDIDTQVLKLYRGTFLERELGTPSIASMRDRLAAKFQRVVLRVGKEQERVCRWDVAAHIYRRGLEQDRIAEEFYQRLIYCEWQLGHCAEVIKTYRRCRDMLSIHLHVKPSAETETLYRRVLAG